MYTFKEQNIFFLKTCFAYTISEPKFTVWYAGNQRLKKLKIFIPSSFYTQYATHLAGCYVKQDCHEGPFENYVMLQKKVGGQPKHKHCKFY